MGNLILLKLVHRTTSCVILLKIKLLLSYKYLYGYLALSWLNYLVSITLLLKCISKKRNKMEQESFKILQEFIHGLFLELNSV